MKGLERETWRELAAEVEAAQTYTRARYSAFRLAVRSLTLVYGAGAGMKPSTLRGLIESASRMLGRFGLDAVTVLQADAPVDERSAARRILDELKGDP